MARELTHDEIAECKEAFDVFDQNKDGKITTGELTKVLRSLGSRPTEDEIKGIVKDFDFNNNGTIEFPEFVKMVSQKTVIDKVDPVKERKKAFRAFDKNGDGYITASELKEGMINLGDNPTDEEVTEMIKEADLDNDGVISYDEFVQMIK